MPEWLIPLLLIVAGLCAVACVFPKTPEKPVLAVGLFLLVLTVAIVSGR